MTNKTTERLCVDLPIRLLDRVRVRLLDPRTGQVAYGAMVKCIRQALQLWLDRAPPDHQNR